MALARVYSSVFAARKGATLKCGHCGQPIAKGERYYWFKVGFRTNYRHIRHATVACSPRDSERESSKMAGIYAAREAAYDAIDSAIAAGGPDNLIDDLKSTLEQCASDWNDVASEYRDAAEAMGDAGSRMEEVADSIEQQTSELEDWSPDEDEPQPCAEHDDVTEAECDDCMTSIDEWVEATKDSARSALDEAEGGIETL